MSPGSEGAGATSRPAGAVAVITDIHGNLPALDPALPRIEDLGVARTHCGGDLVGYGPWPNEVHGTVAKRGIPTIYDHAIGRNEDDCMCAYPNRHDRELGELSVQWTLEHTDRHSKDFLRALPFALRFDCGSVGEPKDGDPRGGFTVLEPGGQGAAARIERFECDVEHAAAQVAEAGLPSEYADKLLIAA